MLPKKTNIFSFNKLCALVWVVILVSYNNFSVSITKGTLFWGLLYGCVQAMFLLFKSKAMNSGPVSITTLIGNCSLVLSTFVGVIVWKEDVTLIQVFCICALIISFILCTYTKSKDNTNGKWIVYCILFFVFAASVGIIFKSYSKLNAGQGNTTDMMIVAAITMFAVLYIFEICTTKNVKTKWDKKSIIIMVLCGILSCLYNRFNIDLAGMFDSAVFYPCFNGGCCIVASVLSFLIFKEKLRRTQLIGLIIGIIAVIIIGIF